MVNGQNIYSKSIQSMFNLLNFSDKVWNETHENGRFKHKDIFNGNFCNPYYKNGKALNVFQSN